MDWITDQIAIGNIVDAREVSAGQVDAILCLTKGCPCGDRDDLAVLAVPLVDGPGNTARDVRQAMEFLDSELGDGARVLVHCHAGRSRSVCVVAAWLTTRTGSGRADALALIATRREVWLSPGIEELFEHAASSLREKR